MKKNKILSWWALKHLFYVYVILAPILLILLPQIVSKHPVLALILAPSWVTLTAKILYDNYDRIYFEVTRIFLRFFNLGVDWSLSVMLMGNSEPALQDIYEKLLIIYPDAKSWHNDRHKKILELPFGCNIKISQVVFSDSLGGDNLAIDVRFSKLNVTFNKSEGVLEKIISIIEDVLLPLTKPEGEKYTFVVKFGDVNPYFGLFVRKLRIPNHRLVTFNVVFDHMVGHKKERVEVSEQQIAVTTRSLSSLQALSKHYITLATLDLSSS